MKRFYQYLIAAPLYVAVALLLCFGSCQSSDNAKVDEGASVVSLPIMVRLADISSRVGMTDPYTTGAFSCFWDRDKLKIYQKYVLDGVVQNMMPLELLNFSSSGTSGRFFYMDSLAYHYNMDSRLYAFSSNTKGGYTASVAEDGSSALKATTLVSQDGSLEDCGLHDALYGSTTIDSTTGLPEALTMNHLFGVLNFHITSNSFSSNYPVTVKITSSAANILPGNDGTATLAANGTSLTSMGSWSNSWTGTITPAANGLLDVYLMTWPFSTANSTLTISCSDGTSYVYTSNSVTLNNFSLAAGQFKTIPLEITSTPGTFNDTYSALYCWDATDSKAIVLNINPWNSNTTTVSSSSTDYSSRALYACKNCPNVNEISWYLSVNCYWDSGNILGGNTTNYIMANGNYTKAGIWFKKKSLISFSSTTFSGNNSRSPIILTSELASSLNLNSDYFFLPAAGCASESNYTFIGGGKGGYYWSSTPGTSINNSYTMCFDIDNVTVLPTDRPYGHCLWQAQ